ncbi:MAG: hypothetical protein Q4F24_07105 [Eubacteriales bacterium]|nr:hypothetical protein [Eubacteriales bacterium]
MGDEWSGLADLLANLIAKYADDLDIEHLPESPRIKKTEKFCTLMRKSDGESIENKEAA